MQIDTSDDLHPTSEMLVKEAFGKQSNSLARIPELDDHAGDLEWDEMWKKWMTEVWQKFSEQRKYRLLLGLMEKFLIELGKKPCANYGSETWIANEKLGALETGRFSHLIRKTAMNSQRPTLSMGQRTLE